MNVAINVKGYNKNIHRKINMTYSLIDSLESIISLLLGSRSFMSPTFKVYWEVWTKEKKMFLFLFGFPSVWILLHLRQHLTDHFKKLIITKSCAQINIYALIFIFYNLTKLSYFKKWMHTYIIFSYFSSCVHICIVFKIIKIKLYYVACTFVK